MAATEPSKSKISWNLIVALSIFAFSLAFRLVGLGWGLKNDLHNASYHPDEPVIFANSRAIEPGAGQFAPSQPIPFFYSYGTLYLTLLRVASDVVTTYTGAPKSTVIGDPQRTDWDWISRCHLAGRVLSCLAGAGTALLVCLTMFRCSGLIAGAGAGLFIAIAPAHVVHSRFQTVDVLATFFLAASLYVSTKIAYRQERESLLRLSVTAGVLAGLSAGTKYTGILAVLGLLAALMVTRERRFWIPALAGLAAALLTFAITTPGVFLQPQSFLSDFTYEVQHTSTGHGLVFTGTGNGFVYTFTNLLFGIGPLLVLLGLAGLAYAAFKRHKWAAVALAFFVPYYLLIGRSEVKFVRYSFPLYVGIAAGFGYLVQASHKRGGWTRVGVGAGILALGGVPFGGFASAATLTNSMLSEDPRDQAARYLKTVNLPVGLVSSPWYWSPPLFPDSADPLFLRTPLRLALAAAAKPPVVVAMDAAGNIPSWNMELLEQQKPPLISFSSFEYFPIARLQGRNDLGPQQAEVTSDSQFIARLQKDYSLDRVLGAHLVGGNHPEMLPEDLFYTDPVIYVWKRR